MPPASRNHRDPSGEDTPAAIAARSLDNPVAIAIQNSLRCSRREARGRPGDRNGFLPARFEHLFRLLITTPSDWALRRPIESTQYVSIKYTERLAEAGLEPSVGSVGDSYDNALAETINGLYKAEVIWRKGPWRSLDDVEYATLEWVDWYNNRRLLEPIGNIPPAEAEAAYFASLEETAIAA